MKPLAALQLREDLGHPLGSRLSLLRRVKAIVDRIKCIS